MKAILLDTLRGKRLPVSGRHSVEWAEGDLAHDSCRRALLGSSKDEDNARFRFLVVEVEFEPGEPEFTLHRLNALYPERILERHKVALDPVPNGRFFDRVPTQPSWRMPDARDLISPSTALKLLHLWQVTGFNFLDDCAVEIIAEVQESRRVVAGRLTELAKCDTETRLLGDLDDVRVAWEREVAP